MCMVLWWCVYGGFMVGRTTVINGRRLKLKVKYLATGAFSALREALLGTKMLLKGIIAMPRENRHYIRGYIWHLSH